MQYARGSEEEKIQLKWRVRERGGNIKCNCITPIPFNCQNMKNLRMGTEQSDWKIKMLIGCTFQQMSKDRKSKVYACVQLCSVYQKWLHTIFTLVFPSLLLDWWLQCRKNNGFHLMVSFNYFNHITRIITSVWVCCECITILLNE